MFQALQEELRRASEPNVGCVLTLTDGSEVSCSHIEIPGASAGASRIVTIICWDGSKKSFGIEEIAGVRLVENSLDDVDS